MNVYEEKYNIIDDDFDYSVRINKRMDFQYGNEKKSGKLKWKGSIDGLLCLAIEPVTFLLFRFFYY